MNTHAGTDASLCVCAYTVCSNRVWKTKKKKKPIDRTYTNTVEPLLCSLGAFNVSHVNGMVCGVIRDTWVRASNDIPVVHQMNHFNPTESNSKSILSF